MMGGVIVRLSVVAACVSVSSTCVLRAKPASFMEDSSCSAARSPWVLFCL
jgi:hypothetical protein